MRWWIVVCAIPLIPGHDTHAAPVPARTVSCARRPRSTRSPIGRQRSRALFVEASRVLLHPRCVNCHPDGDTPHQGMRLARARSAGRARPRRPRRRRHGVHDLPSGSQPASSRACPGAPNWHLAPIEMAWVGKSAAHICDQLKDPDAQRRQDARADRRAQRARRARRVGLGAGRGSRARAGHAGAVRRARRGLGRDRRGVPARRSRDEASRVNGVEHDARRRSRHAAAVGAARRARPHRHEVRLRRGAVRRVHRPPRRPRRARVRDAGAPRRRATRSRRSKGCRRTAIIRCRRRGSSSASRSAASARPGRS